MIEKCLLWCVVWPFVILICSMCQALAWLVSLCNDGHKNDGHKPCQRWPHCSQGPWRYMKDNGGHSNNGPSEMCVAVIVCGRHICGHHCHGLWPSFSVAVIDQCVAIIDWFNMKWSVVCDMSSCLNEQTVILSFQPCHCRLMTVSCHLITKSAS